MNRSAKLYVAATVLGGLLVLAPGLTAWSSENLPRFLCYCAIAALASGFKVSLPGIKGTMSANFFFILIAVSTMNLAQALIIASIGTVLQCLWKSKSKPDPIKVLFNVASVALATNAASYWYHLSFFTRHGAMLPFVLLLDSCIYFFANTAPVAVIVCLTEKKALVKTWQECYFWSFPYYLVGAALATGLAAMDRSVGWETSLLVFPILWWIYRSYREYLGRLDAEKRHVEEMAGLHLRTIEALALAIEAKDFTTFDHLRRVGVYTVEIAKELNVTDGELKALQAASLLHDIGKLAIPEHILSKPGRLTPAEFEKLKIHPLIGAEILESVEFPYPVVPIVGAHHEKWDGSGYPNGLKGTEIPIGARILSPVDCFDALTSDRPYRRALSPEEAMKYIVSESGKSFDPEVVHVLAKRYAELDAMVKAKSVSAPRLSKHVRIARGHAPAAGLAAAPEALAAVDSRDFLISIAAARQEAQDLFELAHELGTSLSLNETLSLLALRLKKMCPYDCIAIYVLRDNILVPEFVNGQNFEIFAGLRIPIGEGLAGWVAQSKLPVVNGNPSVEPGYLNNPAVFSSLQSTLALPLEGATGVVGVLALYASSADAFTADHLRVLSAVSTKLALSVENALKYRQAENCATTDGLTGLPNARSLFIHLDSELMRSKREHQPLSVLVCDLDGFKQVNDQFGHLEGNRVLRRVAELLRQHCREYDYIARMGGDEFVVVFSGYPQEAVQAKIRLFTELAEQAGREIVGEDMLGMSIGEACYPGDGSDAEQLLAEADRRMYKVKAGSRSRRERAGRTDLGRLAESLERRRPALMLTAAPSTRPN